MMNTLSSRIGHGCSSDDQLLVWMITMMIMMAIIYSHQELFIIVPQIIKFCKADPDSDKYSYRFQNSQHLMPLSSWFWHSHCSQGWTWRTACQFPHLCQRGKVLTKLLTTISAIYVILKNVWWILTKNKCHHVIIIIILIIKMQGATCGITWAV